MASHDVRWWFVENQALFVNNKKGTETHILEIMFVMEVKDLSPKRSGWWAVYSSCCCRAKKLIIGVKYPQLPNLFSANL